MIQPASLILLFILFLLTNCVSEHESSKNGYIKAGNLHVYYERTGHGEPLLLLHAGLQDHTMWEDQVKSLSKHYDVITPDLPFHGRTTGVDTILLAHEVVNALLDSLQIRKTSIAGLSMGASVAQDVMIAYPERIHKAILISAGINGYEKIHQIDSISLQWYPRFAQALEKKDTIKAAKEFTLAWAEGIYRTGDSLQAPVSKYVFDKTLFNLRQHKLAGWPRLKNNPPAIESISKLTMPVLIIDGDKDLPYVSSASKYLSENIRGAKHVMLKDVAHMLNIEQPDQVNKLMLNFLNPK